MSTYSINALDQRVGKATPDGSTRFVYAGQNQLLAEQGNVGWTSYLWLGDELVGVVKPDKQLRFVHNDHLGRPEVVTDEAQQAVWRAKNAEYGRTVSLDQIGGLNLGFPGQYYDAETGFWQNGFRDYDSASGRYLQSDPLGLAAGLNTYAYVGANPVSFVDPLGLQDAISQNLRARANRDHMSRNPWSSDVLSSLADPKNIDIAIGMARGAGEAAANQAKCMTTCALENFVGLTPGQIAGNIAEEGGLFALKHAGQELGEAICTRAAGAVGAVLALGDIAGTAACSARCAVSL